MGLDIKFNRDKAVTAGMTFQTRKRGDANAVALELQQDEPDQGYLEWLISDFTLGSFPNTLDTFEVSDPEEEFLYVRANKWGDLYEPLTSFLKGNSISWEEV